jgi:hypothetical protein
MHRLLPILGLLLAAPAFGAAGDPPSPSRQLYVRKCAGCHKLYDPNRYSAEDWDKWLGKMQRKARLTDSQVEQLRALHPATP